MGILRFASSISTCQYLLFASKVEKTAAFPRETVDLFMRGIGHESRSLTAFSSRQPKQKRNVLLFFDATTTAAAHTVCAGSMIFSERIFSISTSSNFLVSGQAQYGPKWTGCVLWSRGLIRCIATFMQLRWPFPIDWNLNSRSVNSARYKKCFSKLQILSRQSWAKPSESSFFMTA